MIKLMTVIWGIIIVSAIILIVISTGGCAVVSPPIEIIQQQRCEDSDGRWYHTFSYNNKVEQTDESYQCNIPLSKR